MKIASGMQVSMEYTVKLADDNVVDSNVGGEPLVYTQGAGQMIPGLEKALEGAVTGESKAFSVPPEEAYGPVQEEAIQVVPVDRIPENARTVGSQLQGQADDGNVFQARVTAVDDDTATVDFNHPLAGQTLHFDVKVLGVQPGEAPTRP